MTFGYSSFFRKNIRKFNTQKNIEMTNIVLPVDFSEKNEILVNAAVKFAKESNGKIFLIHAAPADIGFALGDMGFQYFPEVEQSEITSELRQLDSIERMIKTSGIECEHLLKQGDAAEIILEYAQDKSADYIVMGSHGRSNMYDVFVGSLTKELTRKSKIPVLVIPVHD